MPETDGPKPQPETAPTPENRIAKQNDGRVLAHKLIREKVPRNPKPEQAQAIDKNPALQEIFFSDYFGEISTEQIKKDEGVHTEELPDGGTRWEIQFPDGADPKEKPLIINTPDGERRLVNIHFDSTMSADTFDQADALPCDMVSIDGKILDTDQKVSREDFARAYIVAKQDTILTEFSGDEKAVVKACIDSWDPNIKPTDLELPSSETIESVARAHEMMTTAEAAQVMDLIVPKDNFRVRDRLDDYEGRKILSEDELAALFEDVSVKRLIQEKSDQLQIDIDRLTNETQGLPDDDSKRDELSNTLEAQKLLSKADTAIPEPPLYVDDITKDAPLSEIASADELSQVNAAINRTIASLDRRLEKDTIPKRYQRRTEQVLAQLEDAQVIEVGLVGAQLRSAALQNAQKLWQKLPGGDDMIPLAENAITALKKPINTEKQQIQQMLQNNDTIPSEQQDALMKLTDSAKDYNQVAALMTGLSSLNLPDIQSKIFGEDTTPSGAQKLMDQIVENTSLNIDQKALLKKLGKGAGRGAFFALIIALAAGAAVVVGTGMLAAGAGQRQ